MKSTAFLICSLIAVMFIAYFAVLPDKPHADCRWPATKIEFNVEDESQTPIVGTPVKLVAKDYGDEWWTIYTDSNGDAMFDMQDWPNECPDPWCHPADHNAGEYHIFIDEYCIVDTLDYDGTCGREEYVVDDPCQK